MQNFYHRLSVGYRKYIFIKFLWHDLSPNPSPPLSPFGHFLLNEKEKGIIFLRGGQFSTSRKFKA
jgi:hypothetical protein